MGGNSGGAAARGWAAAAMVALLLVVGGLAAVVIGSNGAFLAVVADAALSLAVVAATAWWAFTTRRVWKRRLNVALAGLVVAALLAVMVVIGIAQALGTVALAAGTMGYAAAARRSLAAAARSAPAVEAGSPKQAAARPWLLVNPGSGGGKAERFGLVGAARARGVEVHLLTPGADPGELARRAVAAGADALGVAGGDGSLGLVAAVALEADVPFVCIPVGTRNHFAMDLGLDRADPLAALDAFAGAERRIDVGVVGGRVFMNNVSLGAYAEVVADPGYRAEKLATAHDVLLAALRGERALLEVEFSDPEGRRYRDVLVLLVANNSYELGGGVDLGARARLDDGVLQVSALRARTGAALAGLAARIAVRRASRGADWAQWTTTALRVDAGSADLHAGIDGEAMLLRPPLEFQVLPRALRVLVPRGLVPRAREVRLSGWATVRRIAVIALGGGPR